MMINLLNFIVRLAGMADPADDQLQLCFNRAHFQRSDFNVERFVNLTRKRATLDQLQNDLRIYLRHLQNAMIELINDDYADFVNLSSSLAALRESVDKVTTDVQSNWSTFSVSNAELERCADVVEQSLEELAQARKKQMLCRDKLTLLRSIQQLHNLIAKDPKVRNASWFSKLAMLVSSVEFWSEHAQIAELPQQISKARIESQKKISDILLKILLKELSAEGTAEVSNLSLLVSILQLINEVEFAVDRIVQELADHHIDLRRNVEKEKQLDILLAHLLDQLFRVRERWELAARRNQQFTREVATFMDTCLLNFVSSVLEEWFSTVLIPSDARLFHKCFSLVAGLGQRWPARGPVQLSLLQTLRDKFNLVVYFKLASQPLLAALKDQSEPEAFKFEVPDAQDESASFPCLSPYSNSLLLALDSLYSTEVFLPPLADKFWEFTLQRMDDYVKWIPKLIAHFSNNALAEDGRSSPPTVHPTRTNFSTSKSSTSSPGWLPLTALHRDLQLFDTNLFQFCLTTIWALLREMHVDTTPFGQCLSRFSEQLGQKRSEIGEVITRQLGAELAKNLSAVSDIPRQYRWTKKPLPTAFSPYLATAFGVCETFEGEGKKLSWTEQERRAVVVNATQSAVQDFCERAEKVLESVKQTGSSLLRFKQRKAAGGRDLPTADTDESKIRAQLQFDANFVRQRAAEWGVEKMDRLAQIEQRAGNEQQQQGEEGANGL